MANNMNKMDKAKLVKIGLEAFRELEAEENIGTRGRPYAPKRSSNKAPAWTTGAPARQPEVPAWTTGAPARKPEVPAWTTGAPARQPEVPACHYQYQPQQTRVYQVKNPVSSTQELVTSYDAMNSHDGLLIMDYSKRKSTAMAY